MARESIEVNVCVSIDKQVQDTILSRPALEFVASMIRKFRPEVDEVIKICEKMLHTCICLCSTSSFVFFSSYMLHGCVAGCCTRRATRSPLSAPSVRLTSANPGPSLLCPVVCSAAMSTLVTCRRATVSTSSLPSSLDRRASRYESMQTSKV